MDKIIPIVKANNQNLEKIIQFLKPFAEAESTSFESITMIFTIPQQVYHGEGSSQLLGYIAGSLNTVMKHYRDQLIEINKNRLEMNTIGAELFKNFVEDLQEPNRNLITLTVPFADVTLTLNFVIIAGQWVLINAWENEVNLFQRAIESYMKRYEVTSDELFNTNQ